MSVSHKSVKLKWEKSGGLLASWLSYRRIIMCFSFSFLFVVLRNNHSWGLFIRHFCLRALLVCVWPERDGDALCCSNLRLWCGLLPVSFLGAMCSRVLLTKNREEIMGECPLPAIKVSLDWLKLRPTVFTESVVDKRQ